MERITSRQNAIVKRFRDVARASGSDRDAVLLDGAHLIEEAIACGVPIEIAAFSDERLRDDTALEAAAARVSRQGGRVVRVTSQVLAALSPVRHASGVAAIARAHAAGLDEVFAQAPQLVLILTGIQDPGNVGAIIRTAAACGATGIVATAGSANPFGWKALRGAMGGTFRLPIAAGADLTDVIAAARSARVPLLAAVPRGGTPLFRADLRGTAAVVLGAEGAGISDAVLAAARETMTIPMRAPIESLNVAVAAGLILYEAVRQRQGARA